MTRFRNGRTFTWISSIAVKYRLPAIEEQGPAWEIDHNPACAPFSRPTMPQNTFGYNYCGSQPIFVQIHYRFIPSRAGCGCAWMVGIAEVSREPNHESRHWPRPKSEGFATGSIRPCRRCCRAHSDRFPFHQRRVHLKMPPTPSNISRSIGRSSIAHAMSTRIPKNKMVRSNAGRIQP